MALTAKNFGYMGAMNVSYYFQL